ncbi:DNA-binding response regulator [Nesterenkonia sp. K-15-9-6]|uniref:DNA-binding response regulator n=1 Tax=Nesterenkonia sp. K-15-9-6 TaxID=3093918 RepID=UPI0040447583
MSGQELAGVVPEIEDGTFSAEEARNLTDRLRMGLEQAWQLIAYAYRGRAYTALGYRTWDEYVQREFGHLNLQPPREERDNVILSLRAAGLSERATAVATGLSKGTVGAITRSAQDSGAQNWAPEEGAGPSPQMTEGGDGKFYKQARPQGRTKPEPEPEPLPGQTSIADELGEDAGDALAGSVLDMPASEAGIEVLDLDATDRGHREQARRDVREFHQSGQGAVQMTIKLGHRLAGTVAPSMGDSPLSDEERAGVVTDSARCVRTLANLLARAAKHPEALDPEAGAAEAVMSDVTDAVADLNSAVDEWRKSR